MDELPIQYKSLFNLVQLGVPREYIKFQTLVLNEKFICIRDEGQSSLIIIDFANPTSLEKRQIKAESAIMNSFDRIIGLKFGSTLQVYNLLQPTPAKVTSCNMVDPVEYWKFISPTIIALVTNKAVFHWDLRTPDSSPVQLFLRLPQLNDHCIINYHVNHDLTWTCLVGIGLEGTKIVGHVQLYSTEKNLSQSLDGHAASFAESLTGATLFCCVSRNKEEAQLFIGETGGAHHVRVPVYFPETNPNDFPIALEVSARYKVLYLITKEGYLHLYDLKSGKRITMNKISPEVIFTASPHTASGGVMCVNQIGQVIVITVNEKTIIPFITSQLNDLPLAISFAEGADLPISENII